MGIGGMFVAEFFALGEGPSRIHPVTDHADFIFVDRTTKAASGDVAFRFAQAVTKVNQRKGGLTVAEVSRNRLSGLSFVASVIEEIVGDLEGHSGVVSEVRKEFSLSSSCTGNNGS